MDCGWGRTGDMCGRLGGDEELKLSEWAEDRYSTGKGRIRYGESGMRRNGKR